MSKRKHQSKKKLNFFTITQKFWKDQVMFYILATISCLGSFFIESNGSKAIYDSIKKGSGVSYSWYWNNQEIYKFDSQGKFIFAMILVILLYCLVVVAHVYFAYYLGSKVNHFVKKKIVKKLFLLQSSHNDKKKTLSILTHNTRIFSHLTTFVPNQLYYAFLDTFLVFGTLKSLGGKALALGIGFFVLLLLICYLLQYLNYKKDLLFQKHLEEETKQETILVNKRDLIIKKDLSNWWGKSYNSSLNNSRASANKRDWAYTLSFVIPSYSLTKMAGYLFMPFITPYDEKSYFAVSSSVRLFDSSKKMVERLKDYPACLSAQRRINNFLAEKERDEIQKNILIAESVESITLEKLSFSYNEKKPILKKLTYQFQIGKVNHLIGENGFGKSTIVNLLMGLYQPTKGEILVNNKYKLSEINLIKWREKIAYAEHDNLVENGLSTGQKQLIDLDKIFATSQNKEIFIFDEADNALDENNKNLFREKIERISKKKLVILISH